MSGKGEVTQPKGRKEIGDACKRFWQRASESTTSQKQTYLGRKQRNPAGSQSNAKASPSLDHN